VLANEVYLLILVKLGSS